MDKLKCKYCGSEQLIEEPQDGFTWNDVECYGDCQHRCLDCGAIGIEVFGHGLRWKEPKLIKE